MRIAAVALACFICTKEARNIEPRSRQWRGTEEHEYHQYVKKMADSSRYRRTVPALLNYLLALRPSVSVVQRHVASTSRAVAPTALAGEAAVGIAFAGLAAFAFQGVGPSEEASAALRSSSMCCSERSDGGLLFEPIGKSSIGLVIFYAGAKVAPASYAPLAQAVINLGASMLILQAPFSGNPPFQGGIYAFKPPSVSTILADLDPTLYSNSYMIAGHSIGGLWAVEYCRDVFDEGEWQQALGDGPKPAIHFCYVGVHGPDLAKFRDLPFASTTYLYAPNDWTLQAAQKKPSGASDTEEVETMSQYVGRVAKSQLPADCKLVLIDGGNHAQYGSYGSPGRKNGYLQDEIAASADMPEHRQREIVAQALVAPFQHAAAS